MADSACMAVPQSDHLEAEILPDGRYRLAFVGVAASDARALIASWLKDEAALGRFAVTSTAAVVGPGEMACANPSPPGLAPIQP